MKNKEIKAEGITFNGMLTILFIGLKLTGYINWSWWWVLAPRWISIILGATVATIMEMNERDKHE